MKKRILTTVLLVVCMAFSMLVATSCGEGGSELDAFVTALENTSPSNVSGKVELYTGTASMEYDYSAVVEADGKFTLTYSYKKLNDIASGAEDELYTTVENTVTYDGSKYSDDSIPAKLTANAVATELDLGADMEYSVSKDGKVLSATVAAEDTESVFGIDYAADVRFVLVQADGKIVSLALEYTLATGEVVKASCSYN